jgi:hypothetical protein
MSLRFVDVLPHGGCFQPGTPVFQPSQLTGHFVHHITQSPHQLHGLGGIAFIHGRSVARLALSQTCGPQGFATASGPPAFECWAQAFRFLAKRSDSVTALIDVRRGFAPCHNAALWPHNIKTSTECRSGGEPSKA